MSETTRTPEAGWSSRAKLLRRPEFWRRLDGWLLRWGPLVLLLFAVCYYGQYYRSGLNLGGEGGTVAVNAMRLNEGWLPIKETTLNYNLMWFYPVAWLFRLTGPDYIALRIYFFVLCTITGLLSFLLLRRVTGRGWIAVGVGILVLAIPGMLFRNYLGLLTVLNTWALLHAFVFEPVRARMRWLRFIVAGMVLGLTYMVRIDVGTFFTVIYAGLVVLFPFGVRGEFLRRSLVAGLGGGLGLLLALGVQAPFYIDARQRGFGDEFVQQYPAMWNQMKWELTRRGVRNKAADEPKESAAATPEAGTGLMPVRFKKTPKNWVQLAKIRQAEQAKAAAARSQGRPRPELRDVFRQRSFYDAVFVLILYLPILISIVVAAVAGCALAWAIIAANAALKEAALVNLVTLGSALTIFSQYFFFRPDTPHLSEFMVPFVVAMACASFYAFRTAVRSGSWLLRVPSFAFVALCLLAEGLYFYHSFPKESAGTIDAARKRSHEVIADNGVRVLVKRREQPWLQSLHDTIVRYSEAGDWVVTFPYSPTINFMTNRPSYLKDLYIDNATAHRDFTQRKIAEFEKYRPAVIVIDQRDINDTEQSRFRNWAAPTYDYIRSHYVRVPGEFDTNEIFVRPDKMPPQA